MRLEAVLLWQNHFGIILSQLLEHMYQVMHIRLPDKHNVVNHFCLQAFLSEQPFPSLSYVLLCFTLLLLFFCFSKLDRGPSSTSFRLLISFRVTLRDFSAGSHCPWYWILSCPESQLVFMAEEVFNSNIIHVSFRNVLPFYLICR